jgi:hypothetical protein
MFDLSSPTVYIPTIFLMIVGGFISVLYRDAKKNTREHTWELPYFSEIALSMNYINRNILEDGRFCYRNNVDPEITYDNTVYNSLRHAGTLYSMYLYEKLGLEMKFHDNRILASKYFIDRYLKKIDDDKYVVISYPEEEEIKFPIAKTGSAGVGLCALCSLYEEKEIELSVLRGLGEFILSMKNEEGNVYAYYNLETKEIDKQAEAIFYPAEAAAGLMALYEIDPQQKWLDAIKDIIMYIVSTRKTMDLNIPFDHWSVLVIEKLLNKKLVTPDEGSQMRAYAEQMAIPALSNQITNSRNSYYGAFKDNIRPCSLGTIMEGLASIYFCSENEQLKAIIFKALAIGCHFLAKVQVKTGTMAGGLPNSANWVKPGVTPNASIIRIDNVQHVVSGWLRFQHILKVTDKY